MAIQQFNFSQLPLDAQAYIALFCDPPTLLKLTMTSRHFRCGELFKYINKLFETKLQVHLMNFFKIDGGNWEDKYNQHKPYISNIDGSNLTFLKYSRLFSNKVCHTNIFISLEAKIRYKAGYLLK